MLFVCVHVQRDDATLREIERSLKALCQALFTFRFDAQTIDHNIDIVFFIFVELRHAVQVNHLTIDTHAHKTLRLQAGTLVIKAALAGTGDRSKDRQLGFCGPVHHAIDHLADVLGRQR